MRAEELRIGNCYSEFGSSRRATAEFILKLNQIQSADKIAIDVAPIPLTEEWLVKLGFVVSKGGSFDRAVINDRYVFFIWRPNDSFQLLFTYHGMQINPDTPIKHVHQLQNLYFALTGEELTIK